MDSTSPPPDRPLRVGVNTLFLLPGEVGGTETYTRCLLSALAGAKAAPEMVLFTNRENHDSFASFERALVDVRASNRFRRILSEQFALPKAAHAAGIDLLFSPGYTAPLRAPCPQAVCIHDVQFKAYPQEYSLLERGVHAALVGGAARRAEIVLTVSGFSRGEIVRRLHAPADRVVVTPEAAHPVFFEELPCPLQDPFLLYVANTYPHKNAARLVEVFDGICRDIPHDLVLVGQPRAGEPPPHARVRRIHWVSAQELAGLYRGCELFVFPSLYEGFGLPLVEAMAAGARIVASIAGAAPETAGDAATYFDPLDIHSMAEAIWAALREPPEVRAAFREKARARARAFSWERCARETLGAFERATRRSVRGGGAHGTL